MCNCVTLTKQKDVFQTEPHIHKLAEHAKLREQAKLIEHTELTERTKLTEHAKLAEHVKLRPLLHRISRYPLPVSFFTCHT